MCGLSLVSVCFVISLLAFLKRIEIKGTFLAFFHELSFCPYFYGLKVPLFQITKLFYYSVAARFLVDAFCFNLLGACVSLSYSICSSLQCCTTFDVLSC